MNPGFLVARARELGPAMLAFRVAQRVRRRAAGARARWLGPRRPGQAPPPDWSGRSFFLDAADRAPLEALLQRDFPDSRARILEDAGEALAGRVELLTGERFDYRGPVDWHRDPRTAAPAWPLVHFTRLDALRLAEPCDIKIPWEVGRGTHLFRMAQAYWLTGDERYADGAAAGLEDFIRHNPPEFGPQWVTPMEVALRGIHWIWIDRLCDGARAFDPGLRSRLWWEVLEGARFTARFLEREPVSGNHYWSDGLGLWYAGLFSGRAGAALARLGRRITLEQLFVQTRPDGSSIESSTGYHRLVTELMFHALRLAQLEGRPAPAEVVERVRRMIRFTAETVHPGGRAPQLGDHDDGRVLQFVPRAPLDHRHLLAVGGQWFGEPAWLAMGDAARDDAAWLLGPASGTSGRPGVSTAGPAAGGGDSEAPRGEATVAFRDGGVFVLRAGSLHSVWDAGPLAKPGNGAHGHADTLSGEVSLGGLPLLVDPGTCAYSGDPELRNRMRGTAAHNVLQVDGLEMAEPGTGLDLWRFLNDVPCRVLRFGVLDGFAVLEAEHLGYRERGVPVTVRRVVRLALDGEWMEVTDTAHGEGRHRACLRWHLAPLEWSLRPDGTAAAELGGRAVSLAVRVAGAPARPRLVAGDFSERWGELRTAPVLETEAEGELPLVFETVLSVGPPSGRPAGAPADGGA